MSLTNHDTAELGANAIAAAGVSLAPLTAFSTRVEGATRFHTVKVPIVGAAQAAADYNENSNNYFTSGGSDDGTVSVVLDKNLKSTFSYTLSELNAMSADTLTKKIQAAITAVATGCMSYIMGKMTAAAFANTANTTALASFDADTVVDMRASVEAAMGRFGMPLSLICGAGRYNALRKDSSLNTYFAQAGNIDPITGVLVPNISGTRIFQSAIYSPDGQNLQAFICDPSAMAVAMGYDESNMGENDVLMTHAETGFSFIMHEERKPGSKLVYFTVEKLIGAVKADGTALTRNAGAT